MISQYLAVFSDKDIEWGFRKTYSAAVILKLQYMLAFLFAVNSIFLIFDWKHTHDIVLFVLRFSFISLMIAIMYKVGEDGVTRHYYSCMKGIIFLSVIVPLYRYHVYQHIDVQIYGTDLALFVVSLWTLIRSIFLILPPLWVLLSTIIHTGGFVMMVIFEKGVYFFVDHIQHIFLLGFFSGVMFFIVWQFNFLLRDAYFVKEIAYKKLDKLRRVESAFVSETTSQVLANELKTPLATASGYAQILQADTTLPNKVLNMSDKIMGSCNTMDSIIKSIRDMSFNDFSLTNEPLKNLVEDAKALWTTALQDKKVRLSIVGDNPASLVDKTLLQSVISNLVRNAIEAKYKGTVEIQISTHQNMAKINIVNNKKINRDLDRLFTVYEASDKQDSTGLGLAFCKDVVGKMNGTISCTTKEEETCFIISLPLA